VNQDKYLRRHYGIGADEYKRLLALNEGRCWICNKPPRSRRLSVDHDHKLGKGNPAAVRGLLCFKHNIGLQRFGDDPVLLRRAADYLERKLPFLQRRGETA
jgi:hypothetical protein